MSSTRFGTIAPSLLRERFSALVLVIAVVLGYCVVSPFSFGQQTLGSITGTVIDSSGAFVQSVTVKARGVATNLEVSV